ncbi:MAG: ATP-binding protein, partial [Verrucomicrobiota bacterium]|nr:ATP-binding protein [Verrucomicrobiota bacterium]
ESLLGVVLLDERLTGEPYSTDELALMFHMLEEVGLALRNCWQHDQLAGNHSTLTDILGQLGSGCLVIGNNLSTLHVNPTAVRFLVPGRADRNTMEFGDLSQQLGGIVFTVLKTGVAAPAFKQQMPHAPERVLSFRIAPFRTEPGAATDSALLLIEDITEHERARELETEGSNLRLIKNMAEHLAHEIGNALVPLSTHEQLLKDRRNDPEFQESLAGAMANGVKRISRLANQMVFLSRDWEAQSGQDVLLSELIVEAFQEAHTFQPGEKVPQLSFTQGINSWKIPGDPKALRHAFSEIILNALQASPENPNVVIKIEESRKGESVLLQVEVRDSGVGFTLEAAQRAQEPFFSTRNVGLGIGLTVSRKIIESHRGRIDIAPSRTGECGMVRVSLPV